MMRRFDTTDLDARLRAINLGVLTVIGTRLEGRFYMVYT